LFNAPKFAAPSDDPATVVWHRLRLGWLVAMVLIIGTLQYLAASSQMQWIYILQRLYYIPVVVAGLIIGWRGGLGVALLAGAGFAIGTPSIWTVSRVDALDQCLEICVFCLVGGLSGALTDRYRKQGADLRNWLREARQRPGCDLSQTGRPNV
jgi:K+-sensing histidine kinase KdpD